MHVVLYTSGSAGDILPFVRVGGALVARGHQATLVTHAGYGPLAEKTGLGYAAFDTQDQYRDFLAHAAALNTPGGIGSFLRDYSLPRAAAAVEALERQADNATLILTCPTFDVPARLAGERTGVPLMWLFVAPVQVDAWPARRMIRKAMYQGFLGQRISAIRKELGMGEIADWDSWLDYSPAALGQWPPWFAEPDESWIPGVKPAGFLSDHEAEREGLAPAVQEFLRNHSRPVLVTGGTGDYLGESFFSAASEAIRRNDLPAIYVTRYPDRLPRRTPEATLVVDQSPFAELMPHCGTVIHHGGLGTLGAAARAGTPQLILAFGADRPDNASRMSRLGLGEFVGVKQWESDAPAAALERVYHVPATAQRCREIRHRLLGEQAAELAVAEIAAFARRCGRDS